jgi:hypothetical protein
MPHLVKRCVYAPHLVAVSIVGVLLLPIVSPVSPLPTALDARRRVVRT